MILQREPEVNNWGIRNILTNLQCFGPEIGPNVYTIMI